MKISTITFGILAITAPLLQATEIGGRAPEDKYHGTLGTQVTIGYCDSFATRPHASPRADIHQCQYIFDSLRNGCAESYTCPSYEEWSKHHSINKPERINPAHSKTLEWIEPASTNRKK